MKKAISSLFFSLLFCMVLPLGGFAQQFLYFRFISGAQSIYPIQQVRKINFESSSVKLQLNDGTAYTWPAATIDHYKYVNDIPTDLKKPSASFDPWEVKVIPNPSDGKQLLRFRLPASTDMQIKVFDMAGKLVADRKSDRLSPGDQEVTLDWPGSRPGQYQLMLQTKDFSVTKKIIRR